MNRLLTHYFVDVQHPEVSGAEHLEMLYIRDRLAEINSTLTSEEQDALAEADRRNSFVLLVESANACLSAMAQNSRQQRQSLRCIPARSDTLPEAERNPAPAPGHV